ncbi:ATP synthase F1 subunit gamma [Clostridium chauvoei]|uniref:ATP synthase gamma chain n=2 Tax=Clostridium chauvoei TaxID=46867 RepID=S6FC61_9CLOT|nr:ATP synthase F1 subunit gamma [Clostridium chauvoei]ATD55923.1 F0F1 ATP synthase subunit gamma [Clostridium chauvoei]ATD56405.1 F0F1 ATP synthase subunit gamma [Clostridium chauvoei]MBX7281105.1 F0F1 ATP synthase subunit gamma [Clostridium chauvoei]MBX7283587.1 F0F1 ATP synthase subunit gamma [Clostridium chauvoei]MBX7286195.1 F0F1 ATP synthase subunit gamma [Clostridium chauvoei]
MGSAGLIEIKRRMKSVESTRKITKAMNLVSTSKLRKARKELAANEKYYNLCHEIVSELMASLPMDYESKFFNSKVKTSDKLYIVISSDTGLCGGFNGNIASRLNDMIENKSQAKIVVAGSKGISYMKRYGFDTVGEYVEIPDVPTVREIKAIYQDALYMFKKGDVSEVNIVFTEYTSPIKQEVKIERLFPIEREGNVQSDFLIEPSLDEVLNSSLDVYFKSKLRRAMLHSKVSEQSARMTAMDGATRNANDILQGLSIKYNRIRQTMITQEISEIVGGAEAQK